MKRTAIALSVLDLVLFTATVAFAAPAVGQKARPTDVDAHQIPAAAQPHRPLVDSDRPASIGNKPETNDNPESAGPKEGMGFKNYGQYVAVTHISANLNIPLAALRTEIVENHLSLGGAIKKLRPDLSSRTMRAELTKAEAAAKKAEAEARLEPIDLIPVRLSN